MTPNLLLMKTSLKDGGILEINNSRYSVCQKQKNTANCDHMVPLIFRLILIQSVKKGSTALKRIEKNHIKQ